MLSCDVSHVGYSECQEISFSAIITACDLSIVLGTESEDVSLLRLNLLASAFEDHGDSCHLVEVKATYGLHIEHLYSVNELG